MDRANAPGHVRNARQLQRQVVTVDHAVTRNVECDRIVFSIDDADIGGEQQAVRNAHTGFCFDTEDRCVGSVENELRDAGGCR